MSMSCCDGSAHTVSEINVIPLIDVLLMLLIIFIVIVPAVPKGLTAEFPQATQDKPPEPPAQAIVVQVRRGASGTLAYKINGQSVAKAALEP